MRQAKPLDRQKLSRQRVVLLATDSSQSIIGEIVGDKTNTIAYSTYGEQSAQQEVQTRLGFNGQLRERSIGWYLLGNGYRAYNPRLMRFHSPDSWSPFGGGGLNAYMYCVGDPVNRSDPTGHNPFVAAGIYAKHKLLKAYSGYKPHPDFNVILESATDGLYDMQKTVKSEKTHGASGVSQSASYIFGPKPKHKFIGNYPPKGDGSTHGMKWGTTPPFVPTSVVPKRNSLAPRTQRAAGAVTGTPHSAPPPTYEQATSGMKVWNLDTIAASQQPQTYVVNRMAVNRMDNLGAAAPYQAPAGAPPPAQAAEVDHILRGLQELNDMQRDVIQHRAANIRRCEIL